MVQVAYGGIMFISNFFKSNWSHKLDYARTQTKKKKLVILRTESSKRSYTNCFDICTT